MLYLSSGYGQKNRLEMLPVLRMGVQGPLYQDISNKIWQLQGTITNKGKSVPLEARGAHSVPGS